MVLIDDKGRVFGKINLIDFLTIIVLIMLFLAVIKFVNADEKLDKTFIKLKVTVKVQRQNQCFIDLIKRGHTEYYDEVLRGVVDGIKVAEVSDYIPESNKSRQSRLFDSNEHYERELIIELYLIAEEKKGLYFYTYDQEIRVNKHLLLKLNDFYIVGTVIYLVRYNDTKLDLQDYVVVK